VHAQARHILKFSPLITDAYFHYTPSQIMFAALLMADPELAERFIQRSFDFTATQTSANGKTESPVKPDTEALEALQRKIVQTIKSCRELLETEPPEKMDNYWGTVCLLMLFYHHPPPSLTKNHPHTGRVQQGDPPVTTKAQEVPRSR